MRANQERIGERVLVHTPFGRDGSLIQEVLMRAGIYAEVYGSLSELQSAMLLGAGSAIIATEALGTDAVASLADQLREQPSWSDFPLLIMTSSEETEGASRLKTVERLGNVSLLERPLGTATLVSSIRSALRARQRQYQIRDHIAQRERDAQAIRESEARFRLAQKAGRLGSFDWFLGEGRIVWSPELEALYGLPHGTFEGSLDGWRKRISPEDVGEVLSCINNCIAQQQSECAYEFRAVLPDGTLRWLRGRSQIFYDAEGAPLRMVGINIDIDDLKQSEAHLRRQWHTFDVALSHTPDFVYIFDLEGRFTYVNRAQLLLWQRSFDDVISKNFFELGYPEHLSKKLHGDIQQVIDTRQPLRDHTNFTGPTGETRQYEYIFVPVLDPSGRVESVVGSTRDMTERMASEEELRASEQRFRTIVEANPFGLTIGDFQGQLEYCNPATLQMLGYTPEEVASCQVRLDQITPAEFASRDEQALRELWETGSCKPYEKAFVAKDGRHVPVLVGASVLAMPNGKSAVAAFVTDLTVLKETEKARIEILNALQAANESLQRANSELEEFAYVASHDIQEPLRMVNSYTQLLLRRHVNKDNEQAREYGELVQEGVQRMERLIRDLLSYSRIVQGEQMVGAIADLNGSLSEACAVLKERIQESGATIAHDCLPKVRGDEQQLAHVFQNLLSNALKYRRTGQAPVVQVSAHRRDDEWVVGFEDNGIGFDAEYAEKIFGLFKRLHRDEYPGTGLGLAICKRIVERYGGRIWAESKPGIGSTFFFALPAA